MSVIITETKDAALLAVLSEEVHEWHHSNYPAIFKPWNKEEMTTAFTGFLERLQAHAYVAQQGNDYCGYVLVFVQEIPENAFIYAYRSVHIDQILIRKEYRKKGIGSLLLEQVTTLAAGLGISRMDMNHWAQNDTARAFFQYNGFTVYNERMYRDL